MTCSMARVKPKAYVAEYGPPSHFVWPVGDEKHLIAS